MGAPGRERTPVDVEMVAGQLGRRPRGEWWVAARCTFGCPQVIGTPPCLDDGQPFPTLFWLTCPWLVSRVGALESAGGVERWAERLATDPAIATLLRDADAEYRARRRAEHGGGADPCADVGIAGQRDPLATKCLHAHVAAALAGIEDPVGLDVLATGPAECPDGRCRALTCLREEAE